MSTRSLLLLATCAALLTLPGNAAEQAPAAPPQAPQQESPAAEPPAPKETVPEELPPNERGSADNNITFPVDI